MTLANHAALDAPAHDKDHMHPPATLASRHTVTPARGLQPPSRRVAAARARYQSDGNTGMSGGRLLVALYQRLVRDLVGAETAIDSNDVESAHLQLVHAQEIVDSLDAALDHSAWDQAARFAQLYAHLRRELVTANISKNAAIVARCRSVVEPMAATWQDALDITLGGAPSNQLGAVGS